MKKITLLALFLCAGAFAQQIDNYLDFAASGNLITAGENVTTTVARLDNNRQPVTSTFTDAGDFQTAYSTECSGSTAISEDFSGGPTGITVCGTTISDQGDACFGGGTLESGFTITATGTGGNETVFIPGGAIGNTSPLVGSNSFADYTILTFTEDTFAAGMVIWNNSEAETEFRVFGAGGTLIDTYTLTNASGTENFFGIIADEAITSIEIEGAVESGELFGLLEFGNCVLSVSEVLSQQFSIYPNPTQGVITINNRSTAQITIATVYDILGKDTGMKISNNTIDISSLPTGIYYLSLQTTQGTLTEKIIKQ